MTTLRWPSLVKCMEWVSHWPYLDEQFVRLYCCVRVPNFDGVIGVHSMQHKVVISPSCAILLSKYIKWWWWLCIDLRLLNVRNVERVSWLLALLDEQIVRLHSGARLRALLYEIVISPSSSAVQMHYNCDNDPALICFGWMYDVECMERVSVGPGRAARMFVLLRMHVGIWRCYWYSIQ